MCERVLQSLENLTKNCIPLRQQPCTRELPRVVNMVATGAIFPTGNMRLALYPIAMALGGCSEFAPGSFAANMIKIDDITALVFASGRVVLVSCDSPTRARHAGQTVRSVIEQVECLMKQNAQIVRGNLMGRLVFQNCIVHNIVAHAKLSRPLDLHAMVQAAPASCKYRPDLFPGLKCRIWLNPECRCTCKRDSSSIIPDEDEAVALKKITKQGKCQCSIKMLAFPSGEVVFTGGRSVRSINEVFFRIEDRATDFYQQVAGMMVPAAAAAASRKMAKVVLNEDESFSAVMAAIQQVPATKYGVHISINNDISPLMRCAEAGRLDEVRALLCISSATEELARVDANGKNVLERLRALPKSARKETYPFILDLIQQLIA